MGLYTMLTNSLFDEISNIILLVATIVIFLFRFINFVNASPIEMHLENKVSKRLRNFYLYNLLFIFFFLISLLFPLVAFDYTTFFIIPMIIFFVLYLIISKYRKSKSLINFFRFNKIIDVKKIKTALLIINILTVLSTYIALSCGLAYVLNSDLKFDSIPLSSFLIQLFKENISQAIAYIVVCYIVFTVLSPYLTPVMEFHSEISAKYLIEIHLTNNEVIKYVTLIETFNDYHVFSGLHSDKNYVNDKIVIPKDKIQYIKFLSANDTSIICK